MEQTDIYDYLGMNNDPIFNKISSLKIGQAIDLGGVKVLLNTQKLYEVETDFYHECFCSKRQVYDGLSKFFSLIAL